MTCAVCGQPGSRSRRVTLRFGEAAHPACRKSKFRFDPEAGLVYGRGGKPVGTKDRLGYLQVNVGGRLAMAHRLIWESVHGPIPDGLEINHKNGVKDDNRIANLELVTKSENLRHAYRLGLKRSLRGRYQKVTPCQVALMKIRRSLGDRVVDLADEYGVCKSQVYNLTSEAA